MDPRLGLEAEELHEGQHRQAERGRHRRARDHPGGPLAEPADAEEAVDGRAQAGQYRNEPD